MPGPTSCPALQKSRLEVYTLVRNVQHTNANVMPQGANNHSDDGEGNHRDTVVPALRSDGCWGSILMWQPAACAWLLATASAMMPEPGGRPLAILCIAASAEVSRVASAGACTNHQLS